MEKNLILVGLICIIIGLAIIAVTAREKIIKINEPLNYSLYFCPKDNCKEVLINIINNSNKTHCAFYELEFELNNAQIILNTRTYGLMHNKFCILDDNIVLTGSMNPTEACTSKNNNNLIIINSKELAKNYEQEFQELKAGTFGSGKQTDYTKFKFADSILENYFCPEDFCEQKIVQHLSKAKKSIYFMTFSFTSYDIAQVIANKKNLDVKGIIEKTQQVQGNQFDYLKQNNISVIYDNNPYKMHHKVFIIDGKTVILGSMNPTKAGDQTNDENILIIQNEEIANKFIQEFIDLNTT